MYTVQLGFIDGTLLFALFMIADRFSPSRVFRICALRAGIYPVGMKSQLMIMKRELGKALGWPVRALVMGTACQVHRKKTSGKIKNEHQLIIPSDRSILEH